MISRSDPGRPTPPETSLGLVHHGLRNQRGYVTLRYVTILGKPAEPGGFEEPK
jgi:hypothetical protein